MAHLPHHSSSVAYGSPDQQERGALIRAFAKAVLNVEQEIKELEATEGTG